MVKNYDYDRCFGEKTILIDALRGCVELIELWMNGILARIGVAWDSEEDWPPALKEAKRVLWVMCEEGK